MLVIYQKFFYLIAITAFVFNVLYYIFIDLNRICANQNPWSLVLSCILS